MSRAAYMLTRGKARKRVLVLVPTTSGFLLARRGEPAPELLELRKDFSALVETLAEHHTDFHLGDEYLLEWFSRQEGKHLVIGEQSYDVGVWPRRMTNLRRQTLPVLERFLASGGQVLALSEPASYIDGRPGAAVRALAARHAASWRRVATESSLIEAVQRIAPRRVHFDPPVPPGTAMAERFLENGERILFFANSGPGRVKSRATVEGAALERWDTLTGESSAAACRREGSRISFELDLPPAGSELFVVRNQGSPAPPESPPRLRPVTAGPWSIIQEEPNVMVLDYCDFSTQGLSQPAVNTWRANWELWQAHGFERPAWDNAVQFKTRVFDQNHFPEASGFDAVFHFTIGGAAAPEHLELAMECPELYRVAVNGRPVDFSIGARWLDPHIRSVSIAALARTGDNEIRISGHPFDVRMELENIYLRGDFRVDPAVRGFRIAPSSPLTLGSWAAQGRPFYASTVRYQTTVDVPAGVRALHIELGRWAGAAAEISVNGRRAALLGWPPYAADVPIAEGRNTLAVRVIAPPRNLFGPFHNPNKPRMAATPQSWANPPRQQPPGCQYDVLDYGMFEPPRLSLQERP